MKYTLTCLTPLLVGDGQKLSPIDYMVWKDHVNVLDQRRIFKLLSKGPRLDSYLTQIKKADKLDFASWGGFAQNFAGRRVPFEHASSTAVWQSARTESLHIPTFCSGPKGPYVPATAIKGALRTGLVVARSNPNSVEQAVQRIEQSERPMRFISDALESATAGARGSARTKAVAAGDSGLIPHSAFKIYLLRVSTLVAKGQSLELGWKLSPRGSVAGSRPQDSTPHFAEMLQPGTAVEGAWEERTFFGTPEVARELGWKTSFGARQILDAANEYAAALLAEQKRYAERCGIAPLIASIGELEQRLSEVRAEPKACLLCLGWGGGLATKTAVVDTSNEAYRKVLGESPFFDRAIQTGMPFPKTRHIVFLGNQPATLPGWAVLRIE